jgi:hypothetical protein
MHAIVHVVKMFGLGLFARLKNQLALKIIFVEGHHLRNSSSSCHLEQAEH